MLVSEIATNVFASKEYYLLRWMEQHQTETAAGRFVKFSQNELADEYGSSPATMNKMLTNLRKTNCVQQKKRGTYYVTDAGHKVLKKMKELEAIILEANNGDSN